MPPKKTEAQKQADKAKKKQQLQLKRELVNQLKEQEKTNSYWGNMLNNTIAFNVPDIVYYDKKGNLKKINPLTKSNNIRKVNKKPIIKLVETKLTTPAIRKEGTTLQEYVTENQNKKINSLTGLYRKVRKITEDDFKQKLSKLSNRKKEEKKQIKNLNNQLQLELIELEKKFRIGEPFRPLAINRVLNNKNL